MIMHLLLILSFTSLINAMEPQELHLIGPQNKNDEVSISVAQTELTRAYEGRQMGWVHAMYDASGLSGCMSRECFMVNALAKMKKAITDEENKLAVLKVGAYLGGESLMEEAPDNKCGLFAANCLVSGITLLATALYWINNPASDDIHVSFPPSIRLTPVQTSCNRLYLVLNETWGWDKYRECWDSSLAFEVPCNATALGKGETSFCCWAKFDPECNKQIIYYMNNTYPVLHAQAQTLYEKLYHHAKLAAGTSFYIAAPTIVTLNLLFQLARYKYQRITRERAAASSVIADEQAGLLTH